MLSKSLIVVVALGFVACGGGDSSSGGLGFPSNSVQSEPTIENGKKVKEVVAKNQKETYSINAVEASSGSNIAFVLADIGKRVKGSSILNETYALNETIDETESCSNGGTYHITGSGTETTGATFRQSYNNCNMNDMVLNGTVEGKVYNYNSEHDGFQNIDLQYISDVSVELKGINYKIYSGSSEKIEVLSFSNYDSMESIKLTISAISEANGKKSGQNNAIYYFDDLDTSAPAMYQTQGKIYIDNLTSFVDYDSSYDMSKTPFVFNYSGLTSGEGRYLMANGGKVKIVVEANEPKTYVDANGDGTFELSE